MLPDSLRTEESDWEDLERAFLRETITSMASDRESRRTAFKQWLLERRSALLLFVVAIGGLLEPRHLGAAPDQLLVILVLTGWVLRKPQVTVKS